MKMVEIVGFACKWCAYKAIDLAGSLKLKYPESIRIIQVTCSGRVDSRLILKALKIGFDGVFVAGCPENECHYMSGNVLARKRIILLKKLLGEIGIEPARVEFVDISAGEPEKFVTFAKEFHNRIEKLARG